MYPDVDPPQYSDPMPFPAPPESLLRLPSFENAVAQPRPGSSRLPTYHSSQLGRYHPYRPYSHLRLRLRIQEETQRTLSRYMNTIYDEQYVPLDVPPLIPRARPAVDVPAFAAAVAANDPGAAFAPPPPVDAADAGDHELDLEEEHHRRIYRLRAVIVDFLFAVRHAVGRAQDPVAATDLAAADGLPL